MTIKQTLTDYDYQGASAILGVETAAIKAVAEVEAPKGGFNPEGFPTTLFEGHKFHSFTGGIYDVEYPNISYPSWDRKQYGKDWKVEGARLTLAMSLNREAAIKSASWGKFQIMGFNSAAAGCYSLQNFVNRMCESEPAQLELFCNFLRHEGFVKLLKDKNWAAFARKYNGPAYAANKYDQKLATAYAKHQSNP